MACSPGPATWRGADQVVPASPLEAQRMTVSTLASVVREYQQARRRPEGSSTIPGAWLMRPAATGNNDCWKRLAVAGGGEARRNASAMAAMRTKERGDCTEEC